MMTLFADLRNLQQAIDILRLLRARVEHEADSQDEELSIRAGNVLWGAIVHLQRRFADERIL
jgi:hypothetical protein